MAPVVEAPTTNVVNETEEKDATAAKETTPSKPTIGIIYPPPEMRNIVDKTASFVARNGPEFEARIRQNEINNKKFNFLNVGDPYYAYYQHKVKESKEGRAVTDPALSATPAVKPPAPISKPQEIAKITELPVIPKEPPPEFEFINDPPSISALDLDVVKLTAQFLARNGCQFLTNLMNREQRNYQFDFLRPQHSLFIYFTKLVEQYTKILIPSKGLMNKLKQEAESPKLVLEQVKYRVEWTKQQEAIKRREEEEAERERVQYAQIDWHDFVVVETVDYQPNEQGLFPPPTTPEEVGTRVLAQQRFEEQEEVEMEVESDEDNSDADTPDKANAAKTDENQQTQDMEAESSDEDSDKLPRASSPPPPPPKEAPPQPPPLPPQPDQVVIRKDYNPKVTPKAQPPSAEQYLISPITGEKIPADKMQEHMRIGLLDPRWVEQRDRAVSEKIQQEEVYAQGSAIESSLKQFAERRTDIFGVGDEETAIGKKIGEEEKRRPEKVTWDGHTASMEAATRAARANITIEEQIQQIHKIKGLLPDEEKERIGPSKPQMSQQNESSMSLTSTASTQATPTPPTSKLPTPKPPPLPTSTSLPPSTVIQRGHRGPLPPHIPVPPGPATSLGIPPQPIMPPPQSLMMPPIAPPAPPHIQPPPIIAIPQPPLPTTPFGQPLPPLPTAPPPQHEQPPPPSSVLSSMAGGVSTDDEPPTKRQKTEESLVSEEDFLKDNKSPVSFRVQLPTLTEKAEWKLNGQILTLTLPLTDMVSVIKAKIHEDTGMPPGKQKLQYEGMFIKDSNTLAYYNVLPGTTVTVQVKERGGRKK